ncbi:3-deoxy-7-phosphoheptulonate synthase [Thiolapillus brandeum]|uniref:Phospho-2-dehydro-3-deoxyheptonate aldolase n=1 Tax=Thiolapillus brandeum TaxID=1076588 RepID=A0A7U6JGR7_9GAMM|nr:3-deoxy-7-phosphoheptulonate synthase [Thiolapillus brandeum]BAO43162.1 3-deoxy-7-phosphoheptulonate synthase [Thiolapillus brandeum]
MDNKTHLANTNVLDEEVILSPRELRRKLPLSDGARETVARGRESVKKILQGEDSRLLVVVGPCSIHDPEAALDYARRLSGLRAELGSRLLILMRVYFEKPRTTVGWKGLINDPYMDDSFRLEEGLHIARRLLIDLAELGLPVATEALDPISPQYLADLFSWAAIGARTTESQTHREMASGLSMPVGFKNGTDGSLDVAINALHAVSAPHSFLGINPDGRTAIIRTRGNACGHVILRGGGGQPNYTGEHVSRCQQALDKAGLPANIMVDCSHGNSDKNPDHQPAVALDVLKQIQAGNTSIMGIMLESHLQAGRQSIPEDKGLLRYGQSVTDACMGWDVTASLLRELHAGLA